MRRPSRRSPAVLAVLTAAVVGVAGCDVVGGDASGTGSASSSATGTPTRTPTQTPSPTPDWDTSPGSVAAVGDSITRGYDACGLLKECPEVSWATGGSTKVDSLAVRLLGRAKAEGRSGNYAVTGARMKDLPGQMTKAAAMKPGLVTVMMGANDACRDSTAEMTSVAGFRSGFEDAMRTLRRSAPEAQVYVSSVPDLKRLWSQGRKNALGRQVWKLADLCPSMLGDADSLDTVATKRRNTVDRRVEDYNRVLEEVCAEYRHCRYDGGAVYEYRFGTDQLSRFDWFHPSVSGQARLAEIAYQGVTGKKA